MENKSHLKTTLSEVRDPDGRLDPSSIDFVSHYYFLDNLNAKLITVDRFGNYKNELAKKVSLDKQSLNVDIQLKEAFFSDGSKITAKDVSCSIKRLILHGSNHTNPKYYIKGADELKSLSADIEGIEIKGENSLTLKLNSPVSELLDYLALADYGILHPSKCLDRPLMYKDWVDNVSGAYTLSLKEGTQLVSNSHFINFSKDAPQVVKCLGQENISERINEIDYGPIPYSFYIKSLNLFENTNLKLFGRLNASIVALSINPTSESFNHSNRMWLNKKIFKEFEVPQKYKSLTKKAHQFFVPRAKGYLQKEILENKMDSWNIDLSKAPDLLKRGLKVKTFIRTDEYVFPEIASTLEETLGFPISINYDQKPKDFEKIFKNKKYDAFLIPIFMDYKIVGEALNFSFTGKNPIFPDITGNISKKLNAYQKTEDNEKKTALLREITSHIQDDSTAIPLFYGFSPFVYNNKIGVENINDRDLYQLWKLNVSNL